jgi:hypothetical protein
MNLIGQQDVNATSYKKAAVIMFNNTGAVPEMQVYEDTAMPLGDTVLTQRTGQYTVPYHPDINIPLINPLTGELTGDTMPIDNLMAIMYSVYAFARTYQLPTIELPEQP